MTIDFNEFLDELFDDFGTVKKKESTTLEFKEKYCKESIVKYMKTIAGFANAKGGYIVFGIKDRPKTFVGINDCELKSENLTEILNNHFDPEIDWELDITERLGKQLAILRVKESINKPVMCKKVKQSSDNKHLIEESRIYYRYNSQTREIKYSELKNLLTEQQELEQKKWREIMQVILQAKPQNVAVLNLATGTMPYQSDKSLIIDKNLIDQIKFIQEGKFVETDGAPTLKLIGTVESVNLLKETINLADWMTTMELGDELNIHGVPKGRSGLHCIQKIIKHHDIKSNIKYCQSKNTIYYYSQECLSFLKTFNYTKELIKSFPK